MTKRVVEVIAGRMLHRMSDHERQFRAEEILRYLKEAGYCVVFADTSEHLDALQLEEASRILAGLDPKPDTWHMDALTPEQLEHAKSCAICTAHVAKFDHLLPTAPPPLVGSGA